MSVFSMVTNVRVTNVLVTKRWSQTSRSQTSGSQTSGSQTSWSQTSGNRPTLMSGQTRSSPKRGRWNLETTWQVSCPSWPDASTWSQWISRSSSSFNFFFNCRFCFIFMEIVKTFIYITVTSTEVLPVFWQHNSAVEGHPSILEQVLELLTNIETYMSPGKPQITSKKSRIKVLQPHTFFN